MKRNKIYYWAGTLLLLFLWTGCEDNAVFDQSADERRNEVFDKTRTVLSSYSPGWVMEYFALPQTGGYNLLMKFTENGSVTMGGRHLWTNGQYLEHTSLYEMVTSNGPVIEFDTYNEALHPFCDPDLIKDGTTGDFEFVIEQTTEDQVVLRGRRTQTIAYLNKIPANLSWQEYMSQIDAMSALLLTENSPTLYLKIDERTFPIVRTSKPVWNVMLNDSTGFTWSFIPTLEGFRLYQADTMEGKEHQSFVLNEAKDRFVSLLDPRVEIVSDVRLEEYMKTDLTVRWVLSPDAMNASLKSLYDQILAKGEQLYGMQDVELSIAYSQREQTFALTLTAELSRNRTVEALLFLELSPAAGPELTLSQKTIDGNLGDDNGLTVAGGIPEFRALYDWLQQTFLLETDTPVNPLQVKLTGKQNADNWFEVSRK